MPNTCWDKNNTVRLEFNNTCVLMPYRHIDEV